MAPLAPMRRVSVALAVAGFARAWGYASLAGRRDAGRCPFYDLGTPQGAHSESLRGAGGGGRAAAGLGKEEYYKALASLDIGELYHAIADLMTTSQQCWPADGPQDGDTPSYAGLFGRLAWHSSGTFRLIDGKGAASGGVEGGRQRFWPEDEWRDNSNLDKARSLLGQVKHQFGDQVSWGDLIAFAGTVGIKASGGPAKKFCFGRVDDADGSKSVDMGVEGTESCSGPSCKTDAPCPAHFRWPEQDEADHFRCNITQPGGRLQGSHSVGLIYVYPEGPQLKATDPEFDGAKVHNRSPRLSALEVRDTFKGRMGWTDRETVALIGGGHTLGRVHGNCALAGTEWAGYQERGPHFEATPGSGRGPTDGTCGVGPDAGRGPNTVTSGFEGPWTRSPSRWNYDYFEGLLGEEWVPARSPAGGDQWQTANRSSSFARTMRLTSDMALAADETYRAVAAEYARDRQLFDSDFADAWYKLVHRSAAHPHQDDLERDAGKCTDFGFVA